MHKPLRTCSADIALLTDHRYAVSDAPPGDWYVANILREDQLLQNALARAGYSSVRLDWADPDADWSGFRCAVFRTTWDYYERIPEFSGWLDRIEPQTRLYNPASLIRWNMDKHYLADLKSRDVPVVPSLFLEAGTAPDLSRLLEKAGWGEAVVKPCISGGARHTWRVDRDNARELSAAIEPLMAHESFMLQPFIEDVLYTGEVTLMIIGGRYTHAVRKVAKPGDFRVQDDHGGTVHHWEPTSGQVEIAERAMAACPSPPAYGRVDLVRDERGQWLVMELEIIEPELWLRHHPEAAEALARAIIGELD